MGPAPKNRVLYLFVVISFLVLSDILTSCGIFLLGFIFLYYCVLYGVQCTAEIALILFLCDVDAEFIL